MLEGAPRAHWEQSPSRAPQVVKWSNSGCQSTTCRSTAPSTSRRPSPVQRHPRKRLGVTTPAEAFAELLSSPHPTAALRQPHGFPGFCRRSGSAGRPPSPEIQLGYRPVHGPALSLTEDLAWPGPPPFLRAGKEHQLKPAAAVAGALERLEQVDLVLLASSAIGSGSRPGEGLPTGSGSCQGLR